jgi:hypothetical protein
MEPIGVAASIVTLVQLTYKISSLCLDIHSNIKSAKADILRLSDEVKSLRTLLEGAAGLTSDEALRKTSRLPQLDELSKADGLLERCSTELVELEGWLKTTLKASVRIYTVPSSSPIVDFEKNALPGLVAKPTLRSS